MCGKVAPWLRTPESQNPLGDPGEPEVLLWPLELQVHWTVSPGWIVTESGEKMKPPSPTVTVKVVALVWDEPSNRSRLIQNTVATVWSGEIFVRFLSFFFNMSGTYSWRNPRKRNNSVTFPWSPMPSTVSSIGKCLPGHTDA